LIEDDVYGELYHNSDGPSSALPLCSADMLAFRSQLQHMGPSRESATTGRFHGIDVLSCANSGHRDQPIRLIVITCTGDRDHAARLS
jgi:hypothetical protein